MDSDRVNEMEGNRKAASVCVQGGAVVGAGAGRNVEIESHILNALSLENLSKNTWREKQVHTAFLKF